VIVIVRLKPTGAVRWLARKRLDRSEAQASGLQRLTVPRKDAIALSQGARFDSIVRKLGTAAVGVTMCAVTAADGTVITNPPIKTPVFTADRRIERLRVFFDSYGCPAPRHIADYLRAADTYGLDYRVLPAISVRESTCGQYQQFNNRWGWDNGQSGFGSIPSGIEYVARQLAEAPQYRGKTLDQVLWTYNPRAAYPGEVKKLMEKIEP